MAHIGMLPQSVREEGGYKVKGRGAAEAERLVAGRAGGRRGGRVFRRARDRRGGCRAPDHGRD